MSKPIYIYEGGGRNPHIIGTIDLDRYSDHDSRAIYAVMSKRVNNVTALEVRIPTNCEASKVISNTSDLVVFDSNNNPQEFHITEIEDVEEYSVERYIYAESTLGELINNIVEDDTNRPNWVTDKKPASYLAYILSFSRWEVGTVDANIPDSGWKKDLVGMTCLEALMEFIEKYECEIEVRFTTDGKNKITGRYIDVKKTIGHNYGKRLEDDKDILGLKSHINLSSIKTAIYPRIARSVTKEDGTNGTEYIDISEVEWSVAAGNPVDKPKGQTILVNPDMGDMFKRFNPKDGKLMERIMYAEWTGETAENAEDLCRQAWSVLRMHGTLTPSIEIDATDLFRLTGDDPDYYHEQIELGDTCLIVSKAFDPELRVETRVMDIEEDLLNPSNNKYAFGKYRRTLATSNIEQEKSIEDKLAELQNKFGNIQIPESKPQYQSGRVPYEQIKEQIQNEFMSKNGYVMAEDSDGFWVMDAPSDQQPTHAVILKGGALGIAKYNKVTARWEIKTFIDGMSVNADCINTGKLSADLFEAGSIKAEHLAVAAIEYIKNGLATEEELNGVIDDLKLNYVTNDSMSNSINEAIKDLATDADIINAKIDAIKETFKAITTEYEGNLQQADTLYANSYLNGVAKTNLSSAKADYTTKYNALKTAVDKIVTSTDVSKENMTAYNNAVTALQEATKILGKRMQEAVANINSNVLSSSNSYADGLKVDMEADIQQAKDAVTNLNETMNGSFKDGIINQVEALTIASNLATLDSEKKDIDNEYTTLYANAHLIGSAKNSLMERKGLYDNAHTHLVNTINTAIADNVISPEEQSAIDLAMGDYNTALGNYRVAVQNAIDAITDHKITNATLPEGSMDTIKDAINSAIQGLASQSYVDNAVSQGKTEAEIQAQIKSIRDLQRQVKSEYDSNKTKASKVYADQYLPAGSKEKVALNNAIESYNSAYTTYDSQITTMIQDNNITTDEYNKYVANATAYATALKELASAVEDANNARLANVYAQARQGMVTKAELEVNNNSVIAKAQQGMVNTGAMTEAISLAVKDLVNNKELSDAISDAVSDKITETELGSQVASAKIATIKQTYDSITMEYLNNKKQADTLINNSYLSGTAKSNLTTAVADYNNSYNTLTTAYNDIVTKNTLTEAQLQAWNDGITALKDKTVVLGQRMQEAVKHINDAIYAKAYADAKGYSDTLKQTTDNSIADVNNAVNDLNTTMNSTFKDSVIEEVEAITISKQIDQLEKEKSEIDREYETLYADKNLTGSHKDNLHDMKERYNQAHVNLIKAINDAIADKKVTTTESENIQGKLDLYKGALGDYRAAVQEAISDIADKKVTNATANLVNTSQMSNAINSAVQGLPTLNDVESAKNNAIIAAKVETIKQTYSAITTEYKNNLQQAETLYVDKYLTGSAKTNLLGAKDDYTNKYNELTTAYNNITNDGTLSSVELQAWNTAVKNLQGNTVTLAKRMQEAMTFINTAIYNASKDYTDKTIPDKLTGYAKTSYVDTAKQEAIKAAKEGMVTDTQLQVNTDNILMMTSKMGQYNMLRNTDFRDGTNYWKAYVYDAGNTGATTDDLTFDVLKNDYWCMEGERALRMCTNHATHNGACQIIMCQKVAVTGGLSYTVSYWTANHRCNIACKIEAYNGEYWINTLAEKSYGFTMGGTDRKNWSYDSLTFTVPDTGVDTIRFDVVITEITGIEQAQPYVWLIKPMMCTGINAQAWTGHPDEIHIGVVSVTEEHGIKVEHSDTNTYSTLDSSGLKIWEHNTPSPIASFGEGNSAFIGTLNTQKVICNTVKPIITLEGDIHVYFSSSGSGNQSGVDSSNCAAGFTGAMKSLCNRMGIDNSYVNGDFDVKSIKPYMHSIVFHAVGTELNEDLFMENICGTAKIRFDFPKNMTHSGLMYFNNIQLPLILEGNRTKTINESVNDGCLLKRAVYSGHDYSDGIMCTHCSNVLIEGFRIASSQNDRYAGVSFYWSHGTVKWCDVYQFREAFWLEGGSSMFSLNNIGFSKWYGVHVDGSICYVTGAYPRQNTSYGDESLDLHRYDSEGGGYWKLGNTYPYGSNQGSGSVSTSNKTVTSTFSPTKYQSVRSYTDSILYQSSWYSSYGDWEGQIYFGNSLYNFLQGASNINAQVYLQRKNTQHGQYSGAKVRINGYEVGTLNLGEGKWFVIPQSVINSIKSGSIDHISLDGKGADHYIQFEKNASIWVQCTKTV